MVLSRFVFRLVCCIMVSTGLEATASTVCGLAGGDHATLEDAEIALRLFF
jgi:hypothetical protein